MKSNPKIDRFAKPYSAPKWWENPITGFNSICLHCQHFRGASNGKIICVAFPKGIPAEILEDKVIHLSPYKGDNGYQFEFAEEYEAEDKKWAVEMAKSRNVDRAYIDKLERLAKNI